MKEATVVSRLKRIALAAVLLLSFAASSVAQETVPEFFDEATVDAGFQALGFMFQVGIVWFFVFLIKKWKPVLKERYPVVLMALVAVMGGTVATLEAGLSAFFGTPISLQSIIDALGSGTVDLGIAALVMDQVGRQTLKQLRSRRTGRLPQ